jgi:hypothetical protein
VDWLRERADNDGVAHLHLCIDHYDRSGERMLKWEPSTTVCREWDIPLGGVLTLKTRVPVHGDRQDRRP